MIQGLPEIELFEKGHRACSGCGCALAMRYALKAAGPNTIVCHNTGCMEVVTTPYPETSWKVPWIHVAFENAAAVASGIEAALKKMKQETNILVLAGDGGTFDIGFQALSGAIERGHHFCYICYDNTAYMNTGIQRSGATLKYANTTTTPAGSVTHGKTQIKKPMPLIVAAHGAYVATANVAYPLDFYNKVKKALSLNGPSYIQIFAPCVVGWKYPPNLSIDVCKMAFETKVTPLYEIQDGVLTFTKKPSLPKPVGEFFKMQGMYKHLNDAEIKELQDNTDKEYEKLLKLEETKVKL
jgi:pyruvate ferredoxin oxidoreductase beta subunit